MLRSWCGLLLLYASAVVFAQTQVTTIPEVNLLSTQNTAAQKEQKGISTTHIGRKEIASSPPLDLSTLFRQNQSIVRVVNTSGDGQAALSIRGFGDNAAANALILVDGFPLTNPSLFAPNFNAIALTDIARIDILQGSAGSLWGDQAVGGVVMITTRHPERWLVTINFGVGNNSQGLMSGFLGDKFDHGLFYKAVAFAGQTNNYRQHHRQTMDDLVLQVGRDYGRGSLRFKMQVDDAMLEFPGGLTASQFKKHPQMASNVLNFGHYRMRDYQIFSQHEMTNNWVLETRLSQHVISGEGHVYLPYQRHEWINSLHPRLIGYFNKNKITAGYDGENSSYTLTNAKVNDNATAVQNNFFVQWVLPINNQFDLTVGGRYAWQVNQIVQRAFANINGANHITVAELGLSFQPSTAWQFFIRRDGNFRFPKANENNWTLDNTSVLKAQTGVSYEAGLTWQQLAARMKFVMYRLQLHNEIGFDPTQTPMQPFGSFRNFDITRREGATLVFDYVLRPALVLNVQMNAVVARFVNGPFAGKTMPAVPVWNGNLGLHYQLRQYWQLRYVGLYTGSRYVSEDNANIASQLPGYWLSSLALQYRFQSLYASFEINNVFNQSYAAYAVLNQLKQSISYFPGMGRNFLLTIKVNLD